MALPSRFSVVRSSIGGQIALLIALVIILVTTLNVLTSSLQQRRSGEEFTLSQARAIGQLAAAGSGGGLAFDDRDFLEKSMRGIEQLQSFELLIIKNRTGDTVYTKNFTKAPPNITSRSIIAQNDSISVTFDNAGHAIAVVPVVAPVGSEESDKRLGEVIVVLNTNEMNATIDRSRTGIVVGSLVAAAVCALAALVLVRRITKPIQILSRIAKRVSAGDMMQRAPTPKGNLSQGEVGILTNAFNEMLDTVETANEEMQAANLELAGLNHSLTLAKEETEERARELALANDRIQAQNAELQELSKEKDEFLGIAAHDLKNPLSAIQSMADMLVTETFPEDDIREFAKLIRTSSVKMFELIRNLLDVNALERGGKKFTNDTLSISPILTRAVEFYQKQAEAKSIGLYLDTAENPMILGDSMAIGQVLDNLISNAVKYSPKGKDVFVRLVSKDGWVRVEIQDQGPGISPEDMTKLFGKFARLTAQPTGGEHSTGLGLSIVKKMVEAMNGNVWCESELGKGATFIAAFQAAKEGILPKEPSILLDEE